MLAGADVNRAEPHCVLSTGAILGEGPVWVERDAALWFVDIKQGRIYRFDPERNITSSWEAPDQVGWILPTDDGLFAAGLKTGIYRFDPANASFNPLYTPEAHRPGNRLNDAVVDPRGALWFGSMDDAEVERSGHVYRLYLGGLIDSGLPALPITNGPAFSPDGGTLYYTDTLNRTIWQCSVGDLGISGASTIFAEIEDGAGYPDGPTIDSEGCLWTGLFGGWAVRRYDPSGLLMREVRFPVANITKIAFGGSDLTVAYVTTARKGLSELVLQDQPQAGDLFAFDPGVRGLKGHIAKIYK